MLDDWITSVLPQLVYDRSMVEEPLYFIYQRGKTKTLMMHRIAALMELCLQRYDSNGKITGNCRTICATVAGILDRETWIDSVQVYSSSYYPSENHYVNIVQTQGSTFMLDLGYSQPVLRAIPIEGFVRDSSWSVDGKNNLYGGQVYYSTKLCQKGEIRFNIFKCTDNLCSCFKTFIVKKLSAVDDLLIMRRFFTATGKVYLTYPQKTEDGVFELHKNVGQGGRMRMIHKHFKEGKMNISFLES